MNCYPGKGEHKAKRLNDAGPASAFAKARRNSAKSAVLDLPFGHDAAFIDENGGGPGLRLRKRQRAKLAKS